MLFGFLIVILLTTVSAGAPAYWITRTQLERQAWSQLDGAQRATRSLLESDLDQLADLVNLFAERPTLKRLVVEQDLEQLPAYLEAFRRQSELDMLAICDPAGAPLAGSQGGQPCALSSGAGFVVLDGAPALLATAPVDDAVSGQILGSAVAAVYMNEAYLQRMAANTGVRQSILSAEGSSLSSNVPGATAIRRRLAVSDTAIPAQDVLQTADGRYYVMYSQLAQGNEDGALVLEVALPVDNLTATENNALIILVGSTAVVAFLGTVLALWTVRQLVAPLQRLTAAAERVGRGDLSATIPSISEPDEISTLSMALHHSQVRMLQALQERAEARDWLNTLVQSIVEGVITVDRDGYVTFMSQGAEALTGWSSEDAPGLHVNTVLSLATAEDGDVLAMVREPGLKQKIAVRDKFGKSLVLAVTSARIVPPEGDQAQLALVLRDVTQEEALQDLRSYFLANISHEFRTPLSTLNASMEMLLDPAENLSATEMRELLQPSYRSLRALQTLIDNLLESSRIEAGHFTIQKRLVPFEQVLETAVQMATPLLERREQPLDVQRASSLPTINADAARLTQVLVNLLTNASNYSPAQEAIEVRVQCGAKALRVEVADRGPGIPAAEREHVFRRFVRGVAADGEQYGAGLGLFVVKTVIEAHGGRAGVAARAGNGSIFWFELPLDGGGV